MRDFARQRQMMVEQIAAAGISASAVLDAMRAVERECFVPPELVDLAYQDRPVPIGRGQTISQPYIVALMADAAELSPKDQVLEVGAGSGYAAAVLAQLAAHVTAIERDPELVRETRERLAELAYRNVDLVEGDGTHGCADRAPFDAIVVSASGPAIPHALQQQLDLGGRLIMPVGEEGDQHLLKIRRVSATRFEEEDLGRVAFVPLVGAHGWPEKAEV